MKTCAAEDRLKAATPSLLFRGCCSPEGAACGQSLSPAGNCSLYQRPMGWLGISRSESEAHPWGIGRKPSSSGNVLFSSTMQRVV